MRQLGAILMDSFHEAVDRKALLVMLILSMILILLCFSVSFESEKPESILERHLDSIGTLRHVTPMSMSSQSHDGAPEAGEVRPVDDADGWGPEFAGGHTVDLAFTDREKFNRFVSIWRDFVEEKGIKCEENEDALLEYLRWTFGRFGYGHVDVREVTWDPPVYRFAVKTDRPEELTGGHKLHVLFGLFDIPLTDTSVAEVVVGIQSTMANFFAGSVGVLIAVLVCGAFVPNMMQKGTLDPILARPISRWRLLMFKYLGGLWFVFILAAFLIVGCWLGISLRTGYFNPWFLACILTVTASFAVIYSMTVFFGVVTRSGLTAALLSIGAWWGCSTIVQIRHMLDLMPEGEIPDAAIQVFDAAYAVLPKVTDLGLLNDVFLSQSSMSAEAFQRTMAPRIPDVNWAFSLGSTAAFTAVVLAVAVWIFHRRDC